MTANPFLTDEWPAEVFRAGEALARLDGVLPASSQADTDSYYAAAPGEDLGTTQRQLLYRTGLVCVMANVLGWESKVRLTPALILCMHQGTFQPVFGDDALGFRARPARTQHVLDDGVEFPIWVDRGRGVPERVTYRGVRSAQVVKRVGEACNGFETAATPTERIGAAELLARLYVRLIRTHPFADGNGRTAWAALQFAAGRLRMPWIQSTPTQEARVALGDAIRHGHRIRPLAQHILEAAWYE